MNKSFAILSVFVLISCEQSAAQTDTTLRDFYPLQIGNLWQYRDQDNVLGTGEVGIADTVPQNGEHYFGLGKPPDYATGYGLVRIDSLFRVQNYAPYGGDTCGGVNGEVNIYRLNEPIGRKWKICDNIVVTLCHPWFMRFEGISTATIFGQPREVMRFTPGAYCSDTMDTVWYSVNWLLVKGIGVYREETIEGTYRYLTGAIINGVQYGTIVSVKDAPLRIPISFSLKQNYPNPFNPTTTMEYELPEAANVVLNVYDVLGREVAKLVEDRQLAGHYQRTFDAASLSSGVYFYTLKAGRYFSTLKMIISK